MNTFDTKFARSDKRDRPVIGMLAGFQVFGPGRVYGFIDSVVRGIHAAARDHNCNLLLACGMNPMDAETIRPAWPVPGPDVDFVPVGPWNTDGLIVVHPMHEEERTQYARTLKAGDLPTVFIGGAEGGASVGVDNEGGIGQALRHLAGHNHRRVAFISGEPSDDNGDSGDRLRAYLAGVAELGLERDPRLVACGKHNLKEGENAMRQIIATGAPFTAVLASNDESAMGAMEALTKSGLRIPEDVALIGFDDRPEAVCKIPPLTTVHHPIFQRGYRAVELLLERIEKRHAVDSAGVITVPTRLIVRRSCGCRPGEHIIAREAATDTVSGTTPPSSIKERLTQLLVQTILTETRKVNADDAHALVWQLVDAFTDALERNDGADFFSALQDILRRVEHAGGDAYPWQLAILALEEAPELLTLFRSVGNQTRAALLGANLFHQARVAVSESMRRQYWQHVIDQNLSSDEIGQLVARLLLALDEAEAVRALSEHLPKIGIRRAAVVLFEPNGDDPLGNSVMRTTMDPEGKPLCFPSREFPPPELSQALDSSFSLALIPLSMQQGIPGYVIFDTDNLESCVTLTRAINAALKAAKMYREANEGRRLAEEANRLKSRFLSTVSHELRTPLSLILGTSELLLKENHGGQQTNLSRIHASAQHLDGLIRDVLDLARNELGQLQLSSEPLAMAAALEPITIVGEQMARTKGLRWRTDIPSTPLYVWADRARVRQVALNLISNAVKFTAHGDVTLRVTHNEKSVTVTVEDSGLGIPIDEQHVIFSEFHQSRRTSGRGYGGLGLGLSICKRLVEMHGGQIGVRSSGNENAGSAFYFTLPILPMDAQRARVPWKARSILIVDNQIEKAKFMHKRLALQGVRTKYIGTDDLLNALSKSSANPPGAVMIEAGFDSAQGLALMKLLKDNPATCDIPVLFYSMQNPGGGVLGFDYLTKPVGTLELGRALQRHGITEDNDVTTILIADDDPGLLDMHADIVQNLSKSYRILKARHGTEALTLIQQQRPDLVLLDLIMPELDGFGVLEAMQQLETTRHIPVVVLTGQILTQEEMARLHRGVAAVLSKGVFTVEETLTHVQRALASGRGHGVETQQLVRRAMAYIHRHYTKPLGREKIARHVCVTENYLTRCFQQELNLPPMTYLTRYRINQAKALLESGTMSVANVAAAVGFSSEFYFSRVFRREVGATPGTYRRGRRNR